MASNIAELKKISDVFEHITDSMITDAIRATIIFYEKKLIIPDDQLIFSKKYAFPVHYSQAFVMIFTGILKGRIDAFNHDVAQKVLQLRLQSQIKPATCLLKLQYVGLNP